MQNSMLYMISLFISLCAGAFWLVYGVLNPDLYYSLRIAAVLVGIVSIYMMFDRYVYLPFLGETVFPAQLVTMGSRPSDNNDIGKSKNVIVKLRNLPKRTTIVYWAAEKSSSAELKYWKDAYGDYSNSGAIQSDDNGEATFSIACPQSYYVNVMGLFKRTVSPHLHYRYVLPGTNGSMFSDVHTVGVLC